jgi:hypothetical protein
MMPSVCNVDIFSTKTTFTNATKRIQLFFGTRSFCTLSNPRSVSLDVIEKCISYSTLILQFDKRFTASKLKLV